MNVTTQDPEPSPEGAAIAAAARISHRSIRKLAPDAGISETRWRQIVNGWQPGPNGTRVPARATAITLARMASAVRMSPEDLRAVGREDAAEALEYMNSEVPTVSAEDAGLAQQRRAVSVYLVIHDGGGVGGAFLDIDQAVRIAEPTGGVVARLPIVADFRPE